MADKGEYACDFGLTRLTRVGLEYSFNGSSMEATYPVASDSFMTDMTDWWEIMAPVISIVQPRQLTK
jgi:hypothetical protein